MLSIRHQENTIDSARNGNDLDRSVFLVKAAADMPVIFRAFCAEDGSLIWHEEKKLPA